MNPLLSNPADRYKRTCLPFWQLVNLLSARLRSPAAISDRQREALPRLPSGIYAYLLFLLQTASFNLFSLMNLLLLSPHCCFPTYSRSLPATVMSRLYPKLVWFF